jgi:hypothetical protein
MMKPIEIEVHGHLPQSSQEICSMLLELERWPDFTGYSILPGIESARFEVRTPEVVGSRIRVKNKDGSSHVEEIIAWDPSRQVVMRFQDFDAPLKNLASHFVETWSFTPSTNGVDATRSMAFHPKGPVGWLMLLPISRLMKKAFEEELRKRAN